MAREASERRLAAILSADVVGYSRLMAEDEHDTIRTLNAYRDLSAPIRSLAVLPLENISGDADGWFGWAELGYSERAPKLRMLNVSAPDFIRSDPRFDDLVRRIGLPGA